MSDDYFGQLMDAVCMGDSEALNELLFSMDQLRTNKVIEMYQSGKTPLHRAIELGHDSCVSVLLQHINNVNIKPLFGGTTPIHLSVEEGHIECVRCLVNHYSCTDIINIKDYYGNSPLHLASLKGHTDILSLLLVHSCCKNINVKNTSHYGYTPLHFASAKGHSGCIELILNHASCTDVNIPCDGFHGSTPIHLAIENGNVDCMSLLLGHPSFVNVHIENNLGYTPLRMAVIKGYKDCLSLLIQHSSFDISVLDKYGYTILHWILEFGRTAYFYMLHNNHIINDKVINMQDKKGNTPLHLFAECIKRTQTSPTQLDISMSKILVDLGADLTIENNLGHTAADICPALLKHEVNWQARKSVAILVVALKQYWDRESDIETRRKEARLQVHATSKRIFFYSTRFQRHLSTFLGMKSKFS